MSRKYNLKFPQENIIQWIHGLDKVQLQSCLNIDFGSWKSKEIYSFSQFPMIPGSVQTNIFSFLFSLTLATLSIREACKKLDILWQTANFNCHLPTLPNYDINIYVKAVIIEAPTHLHEIMTKIKIKLGSYSFIFEFINGKADK